MNDQRMVSVELLSSAVEMLEEDLPYMNIALAPKELPIIQLIDKLRAIIDGPGVEPVAYYRGRDGEYGYDIIDLSEELAEGTPLYLAAPSAPVQAVQEVVEKLEACDKTLRELQGKYSSQAVPDGWLEQYDIFTKDYRKYVSGDASMPFSVLRMSLAAFIEECEKIAAALQPPKEIVE